MVSIGGVVVRLLSINARDVVSGLIFVGVVVLSIQPAEIRCI
jgi:hypothetical protein